MSRTPQVDQKRRRPFRKLFVLFVIMLVLVLGVVTVGLAAIPTFAADLASAPLGQAPTYLLIGTDSRENLGDLEGEFGSFEGSRADVIMLAQPTNGEMRLLSLPRDLKVEIPGSGVNKINAAYAFGGADLLVDTVEANLGVPVHQVIEINFAGFAELVDAAGGIEIDFSYDARDTKSGLNVAAGTHMIDGATAVAYVRSRSYQELRDGTWVSVEADDIGRTGRQQVALKALVARIASPSGLTKIPAVLAALDAGLRRDDGLGAINVLTTGAFAYRGEIVAETLPVFFSNEGGVSYVVADGADADSALSWLSGSADLAKDE